MSFTNEPKKGYNWRKIFFLRCEKYDAPYLSVEISEVKTLLEYFFFSYILLKNILIICIEYTSM